MRKILVTLLAVVILAAAALVGVHYLSHRHGGVSAASIPASGNVELAATVIKPKGTGKHPLIVMPSAWGLKQSAYLNVGGLFADNGFLVVAYTQRGFQASTGQVDFGGSATVGDVSTVIDWAIKNENADPNQIGMLGQSYGAGVSLLAAEHDPRIKAVVALDAWSTWGGTFIENGTLVSRSLNSLIGTGSTPTRRLDAQVTTLAAEYSTQPAAAMKLIKQMSPERSPITDVAALNKNKTAVMISNGFQDALFSPQQVVDLYSKLTGPKRLQLATGDHGQVEALAFLSGKAIGPVINALKWMQYYLQGQNNGITTQPPIQVQDGQTGEFRDLSGWPSGKQTVNLTLPVGSKNYAKASGSWTVLLGAGAPTTVAAPTEQLPTGTAYRFSTANLAGVSPLVGLRWDGARLTSPLLVQGTGQLTIGLTGNEPAGSVFAYLYDVNSAGVGTLISVTPYSTSGLSPKTPKRITMSLTPTAWTIPAGDHLSLMLTAADAKWTSAGRVGAVLGVTSSPAQPAQLTLPN